MDIMEVLDNYINVIVTIGVIIAAIGVLVPFIIFWLNKRASSSKQNLIILGDGNKYTVIFQGKYFDFSKGVDIDKFLNFLKEQNKALFDDFGRIFGDKIDPVKQDTEAILQLLKDNPNIYSLREQVEKSKREREKLLLKIKELKGQSVSADYKAVIEKAEWALESGKPFIYQSILDEFLVLKKRAIDEDEKKIATNKKEVASAHFLKALELEIRLQYSEALKNYQEAANYQPDEALYLNELGGIYHTLGEYGRALEYYQKALVIWLKQLGEEHPSVATSYNNIGLVYHSRGEHGRALDYHEKALGIRLKQLGEEHPDVAMSYNNIGGGYYETGEYSRALENYEQALGVWLKQLGKEHPSVATSYNNIGSVYNETGEYSRALKNLEKALGIMLKQLGEEHPDVATSYNNIGSVYHKKGEYGNALENYEKALGIELKILGEEHPSVATSYNNIGGVYYETGEYGRALENYEQALGIRLKLLGEEHPSVATSCNNIGSVYHSKGEYGRALEYYEKARLILKNSFGENHPYYKLVQGSIAEVKKQRDKKQTILSTTNREGEI